MAVDILIASTRDLTRMSSGKKLEELHISDFMVGTYNQSLKSNVVIFTDGERFRVVKNTYGTLPSEFLSHEEILEFIKDKITIREM